MNATVRTVYGTARVRDVRSARIVLGSILLGAALVSVVALVAGCAARVPGTPGQPGRQGTPLEQALAYNAALAQSNNTLAQAVITATSGAQPLLDVPTANRILIVQSKVADADRQLTPLLADAATVGKNAATIEKLLDDIRSAAAPLVNSGDLGIKDSATQTKVLKAVGQVYALADKVLAALAAGGLLKQ